MPKREWDWTPKEDQLDMTELVWNPALTVPGRSIRSVVGDNHLYVTPITCITANAYIPLPCPGENFLAYIARTMTLPRSDLIKRK